MRGLISRRRRATAPRAHAYTGRRVAGRPLVTVLTTAAPRSLDCTAGQTEPYFNWGTSGIGVLRLAHALLADTNGHRVTDELAESYGREVLAKLPWAGFLITVDDVLGWLESHGARPEQGLEGH